MDTKHTGRAWIALFLASAASSVPVACHANSGGTEQAMGQHGSSSGASSSGTGSGGSGSTSGGSGSTSGGTGADGSTPSGIQGLFLNGITGTGSVLYDAQGGLHVTGYGANGVRYGECSSQCALTSNWAYTDIASVSYFGNHPSYFAFAVDGQGHPRVMTTGTPVGNNPYATETRYLECNANCASPSSWTGTDVPTASPPSGSQFFAVSPQGSAALAYYAPSRGVVYSSCTSGCTSPANWQEAVVMGPPTSGLSSTPVMLAFDTAGDPHLIIDFGKGAFWYAACAGNCMSSSGWAAIRVGSQVMAGAAGAGGLTGQPFAIDPQGRPTVLGMQMGQTGYYWCDSNCAGSASSWLGLVPTTKLTWAVVDAQNDLRAVSAEQYSACTAGCSSASPTWQDTPLPSVDLDLADPTEPMGDVWSWSPTRMTLSLDVAGNAAITTDAQRQWMGGGLIDSPDKYGVFLWLVPAVADNAGGPSGSSSGTASSSGSSSGSSSASSGSGPSSGSSGSRMGDAGPSGLSNFEGAAWTGTLTATLSCGDAATATSTPSEAVIFVPTAAGLSYTDQNGCTLDFAVSGSTATLSNAPVTCNVSTDAGVTELQYTSVTLTSADGHNLTVDIQGSVNSASLSCSIAESGSLAR